MAVQLEKVVQKYYEGLEEGKILGKRCKTCGAVEFPPVYACNTCGSTDLEWVEISGKGVMTNLIMPGSVTAKPEQADLMPYCFSSVELEEGAGINAIVLGVTRKNREAVRADLPAPVHAEIIQREGYKTIVFRLDKEY